MLSIAVVCHSSIWHIRSALVSISENTDVPYELIIINNGACPEIGSLLKELAHLYKAMYIEYIDSLPLSFVWNESIRQSKYHYVALLHDDVMVSPNWASRLLEGFKEYHVAAICPTITVNQTIGKNHRMTMSRLKQIDVDLRHMNGNLTLSIRSIPWACFIVSKTAYYTVGKFDEDLELASGPEIEWGEIAQIQEFKILIHRGVFVHHEGNVSIGPRILSDNTFKPSTARNAVIIKNKLREKYGMRT